MGLLTNRDRGDSSTGELPAMSGAAPSFQIVGVVPDMEIANVPTGISKDGTAVSLI